MFATTLSDDLKKKIYTVNELRDEAGLPPLLNGDRLIDEVKPVPTQEPTDKGQTPDVDISGSPVQPVPVQPVASTAKVAPVEKQFSTFEHLTDEDFEKVKHIGLSKSKFRVFRKSNFEVQSFADAKFIEGQFDDQKDISDYILKNGIRNMTLIQIKTAIRKDLGIQTTADDLRTIISTLEDSGVINKSDHEKSITIKPNEKAVTPELENIRRVETRYSYEGPTDDKNRLFCAKLMSNDRYYTREDIQQMSGIFGYSIFDYRGGFYHNPVSNVTTPYCRHRWVANAVVKTNPNDNDN